MFPFLDGSNEQETYVFQKGGRKAGEKSPAGENILEHRNGQGGRDPWLLNQRSHRCARQARAEPGVLDKVEQRREGRSVEVCWQGGVDSEHLRGKQ